MVILLKKKSIIIKKITIWNNDNFEGELSELFEGVWTVMKIINTFIYFIHFALK